MKIKSRNRCGEVSLPARAPVTPLIYAISSPGSTAMDAAHRDNRPSVCLRGRAQSRKTASSSAMCSITSKAPTRSKTPHAGMLRASICTNSTPDADVFVRTPNRRDAIRADRRSQGPARRWREARRRCHSRFRGTGALPERTCCKTDMSSLRTTTEMFGFDVGKRVERPRIVSASRGRTSRSVALPDNGPHETHRQPSARSARARQPARRAAPRQRVRHSEPVHAVGHCSQISYGDFVMAAITEKSRQHAVPGFLFRRSVRLWRAGVPLQLLCWRGYRSMRSHRAIADRLLP